MSAVKACTVSSLIFEGRVRAPGEIIEKMPAEMFSRLKAKGIVAAPSKARDGSDVSSRMNAIVEAIRDLGPDDFTGGGLPAVERIEAILGVDISAGERSEAWGHYSDEEQAALRGDDLDSDDPED